MKSELASKGGLCVLVLVGLSCGHQIGRNTLSGATSKLQEGQEATENDPNKQIARIAAERAIEGAVEALNAPEQRAKINQVVSDAVAKAVASALRTATEVPRGENAGLAGERGVSPVALLMAQAARAAIEDAVRGLIRDLGGNGEGPLAESLASTGKNLSASVVGGAVDKLADTFPGCRGPDALACIDRKIQEMSRSAASGFSSGVRESIGWPLLIVAGLIGLVLGLLGHWLWSLRSHGRVLRTRTT